MPIDHTRAMVRAALSGALDDVDYEVDPVFGVAVPTSCPGVPSEFLRPRTTWADAEAYDRQAASLALMFTENFAAYADGVPEAVRDAGPKVSADAARLEAAGPGEG